MEGGGEEDKTVLGFLPLLLLLRGLFVYIPSKFVVNLQIPKL